MIIAYTRTYSNMQQNESQKRAIELFAVNNKISIDKWHKEMRTSSSPKRNRVEDIIQKMNAGDTLIVADVTRLSRKQMEITHFILLCIQKEITLHCIKEGYTFKKDINSTTRAFTLGLASEIETRLLSIRTKETQQRGEKRTPLPL